MRKTIQSILSVLLISSIVQTSSIAQTLAFPGAVGFGKNVTGGRGGTVYHVTNLNDDGAGSFRDAVSVSNRIIVFDVSGYISLKTAVSAKSNLTIAGQTAPGEGIGLKGGKLSFGKQSNIIIRHLRIRPGSEVASNEDVGINLLDAHDVIIDHCTIEFAPWNNIGGVSTDWQKYPVTNVTFQNCLIANPTYQQFGAHIECPNANWTWAYNIFANSHNRNPLDKINDIFINNVLYNCSAGYTTHTSTNFKHDIINNYFVKGPASTGTDNQWYQVDKNQSIYYAGNLKDGDLDGILDGAATTPYWYQGAGTILSAPWSSETPNIPTYSAATAFRYTSSFGGTFPHDEMDRLVMSQIRTVGSGTTGLTAGTRGPDGGLYTSQTQTGLSNNGYGTIASGTKPTDTDNDGMPDFWEKTLGLNVNSNDAMTKTFDGYTNIEKYINWLAEVHTQTLQNTLVKLDLSYYTNGFKNVSPTYTVSNAKNGTVSLASDGKTANFMPSANFFGLASYDFTVKGNDGTSFTFTVTVAIEPSNVVANKAPTVSITAPANNYSTTEPASITITANAADSDGTITKVEFYNGTTLLGSDNASPYSYTWSNVAAGSYAITAVATDNSGASTKSSVVTVVVNAVPQKATLTKQGAGSSNQTITIGASIVNFSYVWANANSVTVTGMPTGVLVDINNTTKTVSISGTPTVTGVFKFAVTTVGGSPDSTRSGSITVNDLATEISIDNVANQDIICPNPFDNYFKIKQNGVFDYQLIDCRGNIVLEGEAEKEVLVNNVLPQGIYLLKLNYEGKLFTHKLLKN